MTPSLLELPPELLIGILSLAPVRTLLKFSECSHYARCLANTSLRSLHLDFCSGHHSYRVSKYISPRRMPSLDPLSTSLELLEDPRSTRLARFLYTSLSGMKEEASTRNESPRKIAVRVKNAHIYEHGTLVNFQSALATSILGRYHNALQDLEIYISMFTVPMAKAVSRLPALKSLSIKVEEYTCPRTAVDNSIAVEREAWRVMTCPSAWHGRLLVLKIENASLTMSDLAKVIRRNPRCRELRLKRCRSIGTAFWHFLENDTRSCAALQTLIIAECGDSLSTASLKAIEKLKGLKYLDLRECFGLETEIVENWNKNIGHIPTMLPPKTPKASSADVLEVDSDYTSDD